MGNSDKRYPPFQLQNALWANGGADRERFGSLLSVAYESRKGADMLDEVSTLGYKFMYEGLWNVNAACNHITKTIVMDSYHTSENMAPAFIHEVNHALQFSRIGKDVSKLNAADYIVLHRALEADACAHQAAFTWEMKDNHPRMFQEEMKSPIMRAYAAEMEKSGDIRKAMRASFESWFDFKTYRDVYEEGHCKDVMHICSLAEKNPDGGYFSDSFSVAEICKVCHLEEKPYINPDFLKSDKARAVSAETKRKLSSALLEVSRKSGLIADKSVAALPVYKENAASEKTAVLSAAVKKRVQNSGR